MKIERVEITTLEVPHTNDHLQYWIPQWRIIQVCRLVMDNGVVGWGESVKHAMGAIPVDVADRVVGREAASLLWQDELGYAVQIALFDAVGKHLNVPVHRLLGAKIRDWCPISWWTIDMPAADWAQQCEEAVVHGYTTAKLKTRTMYDLHAGIRAILKVIPPQFRLDLDFNGSLVTAAQALPLLKSLEQYEQVAMIETPIPQKDVAGNQQIRRQLNRPIAMHMGDPPTATAITQDVTDGFILGGPAKELLKMATVCELANKPFWLQMVGTGITTTWAAHVAAVCSHARWPSITSMNIWESQLVQQPIEVRGGYYPVPDEPGLGVEVDETALRKYAVDHDDVKPPKHLYRYSRASGEVTYYGCASKSVLHGTYVRDGMPICEAGSNLEVMVDDGSPAFEQLYGATRNGQTVRRSESTTPA